MDDTDWPPLRTRVSPLARRASMARFRRLIGRTAFVGGVGLAIAMTAIVCTTTRLLG